MAVPVMWWLWACAEPEPPEVVLDLDVDAALEAVCTVPPAEAVEAAGLPIVDLPPVALGAVVVVAVGAITTVDARPVDASELAWALVERPGPAVWAVAADVPGTTLAPLLAVVGEATFVARSATPRVAPPVPDPTVDAQRARETAAGIGCASFQGVYGMVGDPRPEDPDPLCGTLRTELSGALRACPDVSARRAFTLLQLRRGTGGQLAAFTVAAADLDAGATFGAQAGHLAGLRGASPSAPRAAPRPVE